MEEDSLCPSIENGPHVAAHQAVASPYALNLFLNFLIHSLHNPHKARRRSNREKRDREIREKDFLKIVKGKRNLLVCGSIGNAMRRRERWHWCNLVRYVVLMEEEEEGGAGYGSVRFIIINGESHLQISQKKEEG